MSVATMVEPAHLWLPDYDDTLGPDVGEMCSQAGLIPDPEQQLILDAIFARRGSRSAFMRVGVVAPRQNLKTGAFKMAALGVIFILDLPLVVWTAHEFDTTKEDHRSLADIVLNHPPFSARVKRVYEGNGDESIELLGSQRIIFKARTKVKGRGIAGPRVLLDEAFALRPEHMGSLTPTLSVQPDPQLWFGSSAGHAESSVLRTIRNQGYARSSSRLAWFEWAARLTGCESDRCEHEPGTPGCEYDDVERWAEANTMLGRVRANGTGLTVEYVRELDRATMPPHEFGRERLGIWDEPEGTEAAFGPGRWEAVGGVARPEELRTGALAVAVSYDLSWGCIGAAGVDGDGVTHLKPLSHRPGTEWIVERAVEAGEEYGVPTLIDSKGPAADLIEDLREAGVDLRELTTTDACDACAWLYKAVKDRRAAHGSYLELDLAAASAVQRPIGDRWAWGRKQSSSDISPLETVTFAGWWAWNHRDDGEPGIGWA